MKKKLLLGSYAALAMGLMSSCSHDFQTYEQNQKEQFAANWQQKFGAIDPAQNWNMATRAHADITLADDALENYTVLITTENPNYSTNALLLARQSVSTDASGVGRMDFTFDMPSNISKLYVTRVNKNNRALVTTADVMNGELNVNFGAKARKSQAKTRSGAIMSGDLPTMECPYTISELEAMLNDCEEMQESANPNRVDGGAKVKVTTPLTRTGFINKYANFNTVIVADDGDLTIGQGKLEGVTLIVMNGGKVRLTQGGESNSALSTDSDTKIIIMPGGELVDENNSGTYSMNLGAPYLYNAGTIKVHNININSLLDETWQQCDAVFYNAPGGEVYADVITLVDSYSVITNWGHITCETITNKGDQSGLGTINNGCQLTATESIFVASINQAPSTLLETKVMRISGGGTVGDAAGGVTMRENTIIRCDELRMNLGGIYYVGSADESALFSAKEITQFNSNNILNGSFWFENNEIIGGDPGFYQGNIENAISNGGVKGLCKVGEADLTILPAEEGDCVGEGNIPTKPDKTPEVKAYPWLIACEDLGSTDDYDFNDIVFSVSHVLTDTESYLEMTPLAAGGVYEANIYYDNQPQGEIHSLINGTTCENGKYPMLNTKGWSGAGATIRLGDVDREFSMTTAMQHFRIEVTGNTGTVEIDYPATGTAPMMMLLPGTWKWPTERTSITKAYPRFADWSANSGSTEWVNTVTGDVVDWSK